MTVAERLTILALTSFPLGAVAVGEMDYGSWQAGTVSGGDGTYAGTTNDSGDVFGEYCDYENKNCRWVLLTLAACDKGHTYPALGNTDKGAASLELVCAGEVSSGKYRYFFNNWKDLEALVKTSARFGLAVPMQADQFQVHRFLLNGLIAATQYSENLFSAGIQAREHGKDSRPVVPTSGTQTTTL